MDHLSHYRGKKDDEAFADLDKLLLLAKNWLRKCCAVVALQSGAPHMTMARTTSGNAVACGRLALRGA